MPLPVPTPHIVTPDEFADPDIRTLLNAVKHTGALARESIDVPGSDRRVDVIRPCDLETLLDQSAADPEQNLPYWAEIWPSGVALASAILSQPERIAGQPVLEIGCGVGITAAIAMAMGARLVATDYAPEALILTRITSRLLTGNEPQTRQINWRSPDADLLQADGSRWPVVLAADVLYEQRDIEPILAVFDRIVAPNGIVWLADQDRAPANTALELAAARGWRITSATMAAAWLDLQDTGVIVRVHQMRHPGRSETLTR